MYDLCTKVRLEASTLRFTNPLQFSNSGCVLRVPRCRDCLSYPLQDENLRKGRVYPVWMMSKGLGQTESCLSSVPSSPAFGHSCDIHPSSCLCIIALCSRLLIQVPLTQLLLLNLCDTHPIPDSFILVDP